jgi:hypothetical protein
MLMLVRVFFKSKFDLPQNHVKSQWRGLKMVTENKIEVKESGSNWFEEYDKPQEQGDLLPIFEMKLKDNQIARTEKIIFLTEGEKKLTRFGEAIIFNIKHNDVEKVWFIKKTQYNLLNPIAKQRKIGLLAFREAEVQRAGSGQKETKWSIRFL